MLSAAAFSPRSVGIPFGDPIAQSLLDDSPQESSLGVFVTSASRQGFGELGIFGIDDALIASAIPAVTKIVQGISKASQATTDPISRIWQSLPASAIGATVGQDGWWYKDGQRLTHEDAARLQQQVTAGTIGATVDPTTGWWMKDGQQLTHAAAWTLYQQISGVAPTESAGGTTTLWGSQNTTTPKPAPVPNHPITAGGLGFSMPSTQTLLIVGVAVALLVFSKRRAS